MMRVLPFHFGITRHEGQGVLDREYMISMSGARRLRAYRMEQGMLAGRVARQERLTGMGAGTGS